MSSELWQKRPEESREAHAAFEFYFRLPPRERSINEAYRVAKGCQEGDHLRAPGNWQRWSVQHEWVRRSAAYDAYLAEQDAALWEARRKEMREQDWAQGEALRALFNEALPTARLFVRSSTSIEHGYPTIIDATGTIVRHGKADRQVITTAFSLVELARVLIDASKLQRLATDEPTAHLHLSGAALDALIEHELAKLADQRAGGTSTYHP